MCVCVGSGVLAHCRSKPALDLANKRKGGVGRWPGNRLGGESVLKSGVALDLI